jgi:iron complex transport system ATP-binding protein
MDLLTAEGLAAGYGKEPVIREVSLSVPSGGITGVIGPNGAGKTTLLRTLSRALKPRQGTVRFRDRDITDMPRREFARRVAVIPQFQSVPPPFTVSEFVSMGRYPHRGRLSPFTREDREIISESLELLELSHLKDRRVNLLSGGEMQRVFLAQGLAQRPELLLMDEPTAHLDISHAIRALDLADSLTRSKSLTVLVTLHDLNLAAAYCDRLVMLRQGSVYAAGVPGEVLTEQTIGTVYRTRVRVQTDPLTARPHVYFLKHSGNT